MAIRQYPDEELSLHRNLGCKKKIGQPAYAIYKRFFEKPSNFGLNHMGVFKNKGTTKWMVYNGILMEDPIF